MKFLRHSFLNNLTRIKNSRTRYAQGSENNYQRIALKDVFKESAKSVGIG
jgi:hypothetical protein